RLRFQGLRDLLLAALLALVVWLTLDILDAIIGPLGYADSWYAYLANGVLIYYLSVVGLQANYAAVVPLRFEPEAAGREFSSSLNEGLGATTPAEHTLTPVAEESFGPPEAVPMAAARPPAKERSSAEVRTADAPLAAELAPALRPWRAKLLRLMDEEQPWLEPELTLADLAHRLRTNTSLLSHVINTGCGQNFNDFVNRYRVAEAERKLQDPRLSHYSLVGIALESGFNSKSTFNRVFKKLTGRPPGEVTRPKS
ncbi:MAG TPA: helix-turn-helix transcriptional regulator, partial [Hymenobacter sp.]